LFAWNQRLNGPMSNTCEQMADEARLEYLTSCMIQTKDGKRVWEDYSDYLKEKNQAFAVKSRFEVMLYLQGLPTDFLDKTPEAQAIKEVEAEIQERAKKALEEIEKSREAAEAGEDEPEEEVKEKATRKPRRKTSSE
jgi:hypothetical protein